MRCTIFFRRWSLLAGLCAAPLFAGSYSSPVAACGCLTPAIPPPPMPGQVSFAVNQQSEQIIFEVGDGYVDAHVLIRYAGAPESFGWLIPIPSVPEISLSYSGTFGLIDGQTKPAVGVDFTDVCPSQAYQCREHPRPSCPQSTPGSAGPVQFAADSSGLGAMGTVVNDGIPVTVTQFAPSSPPPVVVYAREQIGGYETVVLGSGDAGAIVEWLNENDFITNETMTPYMQPYLDAEMLFVAARLVPGAGVAEIRPLRLRYEGTEASIPLQLTAVAAEPHLTVTAYIYSSTEFRPVDHPVVTPNVELIAMSVGRVNYPMVLNRTIDDAGGDAFVREYYGAPPRYTDTGQGCCNGTAAVSNELGFAGAPATAPASVSSAGAAAESTDAGVGGAGSEVTSSNAGASAGAGQAGAVAIDPTLSQVPDLCGIAGDGQCQCPLTQFDQPDCAAQEELTGSIALLNDLAARHTVMTRLTTRLSPEEMTFDPVFEPTTAGTTGNLILRGRTYTTLSCADRVVEQTELLRQQSFAGCATIYCGAGECAATAAGAGCLCDAGYVARTFTDLDGSPSLTCVPAIGTVDLAAGGVEVPDVCSVVAASDVSTCVDVGGFPAIECAEGYAAVLLPLGPTPSCQEMTELSGEPGAFNSSRFLAEADVCEPPPPTCSAFGWLERIATVAVPGVECESTRPDPSWLEIPPMPTCADQGAVVATGASATSAMMTTMTRPDVLPAERSSIGGQRSGCALGGSGRSRAGLELVAALTLLAGAVRRRRAKRSAPGAA